MTTAVDLLRPCTCAHLLVEHRDGKCWVVPGVGAFCKCPEYKEACEKVSACCWKAIDETGACGKCREHNGFDCLTHEEQWDGDEACGR